MRTCQGDIDGGVKLFRHAQGLFRLSDTPVMEMIVTNLLTNAHVMLRPDHAEFSRRKLELADNAEYAVGYARFAARLWSVMYDFNSSMRANVSALEAKEGFRTPAIFSAFVSAQEILTRLTFRFEEDAVFYAEDTGSGGEYGQTFGGGGGPSRLSDDDDIARHISDLVTFTLSLTVDEFLPWSLLYSIFPYIAAALLYAPSVRWSSRTPPPGCALEDVLPAVSLAEAVCAKGAKAQSSCALFCRLIHALLGEARDPIGFGATRGWGASRLAALERALASSTPANTAGHACLEALSRYHLRRGSPFLTSRTRATTF